MRIEANDFDAYFMPDTLPVKAKETSATRCGLRLTSK
jgi:hypothetical protein